MQLGYSAMMCIDSLATLELEEFHGQLHKAAANLALLDS